jgi:hypothetical protein
VWVASLDGSQRARVSGGEGTWQEVAAADNGRIVGVQRNAGVSSLLSRYRVWEPTGAVAFDGALNAPAGWSLNAYPLGLDISGDGVFIVYGFSNSRLSFINPGQLEFEDGFYAKSVNNVVLEPVKVTSREWPTLFGRRVVAAVGSQAQVQADPGAPFATDFTPWLESASIPDGPWELRRTDVAATGTIAAFEIVKGSGTTAGRIGVLSVAGLGGATTGAVDCFLPTAGIAKHVSLSQDGTRIAWRDDQGIKVAGAPGGTADLCTLASPPVVISATGELPSIGGADVSAFLPPPPPAPPPAAPAPPPPPPPAPTRLSVTAPARAPLTALAGPAGLRLPVTAPAAGRVSGVGTVPARRIGLRGTRAVRVITGSALARQAGPVTLRLKLTPAGRAAVRRLKGARVTLRVTFGRAVVSRVVTLR